MPYLEWSRRFAGVHHWSWQEIWRAAAHTEARSRSILWWKILQNRWCSPERASGWQRDESGLCPLCGGPGSTAHVFVECREARVVWMWLAQLWDRITDGGVLRIDHRSVLSGFALPAVRAWRPLRRLRLALFCECLGAIVDAHWAARRVPLEFRVSESLLSPYRLAFEAVRTRARYEWEVARFGGAQAKERFAATWQAFLDIYVPLAAGV